MSRIRVCCGILSVQADIAFQEEKSVEMIENAGLIPNALYYGADAVHAVRRYDQHIHNKKTE